MQRRRFALADVDDPTRFLADGAERDAALLRAIPRRAGFRRCVLLYALQFFSAALAGEGGFVALRPELVAEMIGVARARCGLRERQRQILDDYRRERAWRRL